MKNLIITLVSVGVMATSGVVVLNHFSAVKEDSLLDYSNAIDRNSLFIRDNGGKEKSLPKYSQPNTADVFNDNLLVGGSSSSAIVRIKSNSNAVSIPSFGNTNINAFPQENNKKDKSAPTSLGGGMAGSNAFGLYAASRSRVAEGGGFRGNSVILSKSSNSIAGMAPDSPFADGDITPPDDSSVSPGNAGGSTILPDALPVGDGVGILLILAGLFGWRIFRNKL